MESKFYGLGKTPFNVRAERYLAYYQPAPGQPIPVHPKEAEEVFARYKARYAGHPLRVLGVK